MQDEFVKTADGDIINTNSAGYDRYRVAREKAAREKELAKKVEKLESDMSDIKNLLLSINNRIK